MTPLQVVTQLRLIASKISNSKSPDRSLVIRDLKKIIASVNLSGAPEEVRQVAEEFIKNAKKKIEQLKVEHPYDVPWHLDNLIYVNQEDEDGQEVWHIGPNFDGVGDTILFKVDQPIEYEPQLGSLRTGKWYYRKDGSNQDIKMTGGFEEALSNASKYFTKE